MPLSKGKNKTRMQGRRDVQPKIDVVQPKDEAPIPHIVEVLADSIKREGLREICQSFKNKELLKEVRYGVEGITLDKVAELLTAF